MNNKASVKTNGWNFILLVILSCIALVLTLDSLWNHYNRPERSNNTNNIKNTVLSHFIENPDLNLPALNQQLLQISPAISVQTVDTELSTTSVDTTNVFEEIKVESSHYLLLNHTKLNQALLIGPIVKPHSNFQWIGTLGFYVVISLFLFAWLRPILTGLNRLSRAAHTFSQHPKQQFESVNAPFPVDNLAESFNDMAKKIGQLFSVQQDLTNGLSHELRTPLARCKFALASLEKESPDNLMVASIHQDVQEMERIVEGILTYARLDNIDTVGSLEDCDLEAIINDVINNHHIPDHLTIKTQIDLKHSRCNADLMYLAISNIFGNALRYANKEITVSSRMRNDKTVISIEDDGQGIPEDKIDNVTKAFQKGSDSIGFGLGMALSLKVLSIHNGELEIESPPSGGCIIKLAW